MLAVSTQLVTAPADSMLRAALHQLPKVPHAAPPAHTPHALACVRASMICVPEVTAQER